MTTCPSTAVGSGKSLTYCSRSRPPCSRKTTALMISPGRYVGSRTPAGRGGCFRMRSGAGCRNGDAARHDRGKNHVARRFDLVARQALGIIGIAARERADERLVLALELLRAVAQTEAEVEKARHFVEEILDR